jgi:hypothetical protein
LITFGRIPATPKLRTIGASESFVGGLVKYAWFSNISSFVFQINALRKRLGRFCRSVPTIKRSASRKYFWYRILDESSLSIRNTQKPSFSTLKTGILRHINKLDLA